MKTWFVSMFPAGTGSRRLHRNFRPVYTSKKKKQDVYAIGLNQMHL